LFDKEKMCCKDKKKGWQLFGLHRIQIAKAMHLQTLESCAAVTFGMWVLYKTSALDGKIKIHSTY
jgi:hypothetical protein